VFRTSQGRRRFSINGAGQDDAYGDVRRMSTHDARERALRIIDNRTATAHMTAGEKDQVERQVRIDTTVARRVLVTENEHYRSAFAKAVTNPQATLYLDDDERKAMRAWDEFRAMSEGTTTAGGFGIPVFIDPSIIMTAQATNNPFLQICRQVNVNTKQWLGVSSAGVSWSFDTEASAVSNDSPTLAQPQAQCLHGPRFHPLLDRRGWTPVCSPKCRRCWPAATTSC
jgi:HK97 family phage major capsid protein